MAKIEIEKILNEEAKIVDWNIIQKSLIGRGKILEELRKRKILRKTGTGYDVVEKETGLSLIPIITHSEAYLLGSEKIAKDYMSYINQNRKNPKPAKIEYKYLGLRFL